MKSTVIAALSVGATGSTVACSAFPLIEMAKKTDAVSNTIKDVGSMARSLIMDQEVPLTDVLAVAVAASQGKRFEGTDDLSQADGSNSAKADATAGDIPEETGSSPKGSEDADSKKDPGKPELKKESAAGKSLETMAKTESIEDSSSSENKGPEVKLDEQESSSTPGKSEKSDPQDLKDVQNLPEPEVKQGSTDIEAEGALSTEKVVDSSAKLSENSDSNPVVSDPESKEKLVVSSEADDEEELSNDSDDLKSSAKPEAALSVEEVISPGVTTSNQEGTPSITGTNDGKRQLKEIPKPAPAEIKNDQASVNDDLNPESENPQPAIPVEQGTEDLIVKKDDVQEPGESGETGSITDVQLNESSPENKKIEVAVREDTSKGDAVVKPTETKELPDGGSSEPVKTDLNEGLSDETIDVEVVSSQDGKSIDLETKNEPITEGVTKLSSHPKGDASGPIEKTTPVQEAVDPKVASSDQGDVTSLSDSNDDQEIKETESVTSDQLGERAPVSTELEVSSQDPVSKEKTPIQGSVLKTDSNPSPEVSQPSAQSNDNKLDDLITDSDVGVKKVEDVVPGDNLGTQEDGLPASSGSELRKDESGVMVDSPKETESSDVNLGGDQQPVLGTKHNAKNPDVSDKNQNNPKSSEAEVKSVPTYEQPSANPVVPVNVEGASEDSEPDTLVVGGGQSEPVIKPSTVQTVPVTTPSSSTNSRRLETTTHVPKAPEASSIDIDIPQPTDGQRSSPSISQLTPAVSTNVGQQGVVRSSITQLSNLFTATSSEGPIQLSDASIIKNLLGAAVSSGSFPSFANSNLVVTNGLKDDTQALASTPSISTKKSTMPETSGSLDESKEVSKASVIKEIPKIKEQPKFPYSRQILKQQPIGGLGYRVSVTKISINPAQYKIEMAKRMKEDAKIPSPWSSSVFSSLSVLGVPGF